ncbi:helix-turn-helix domain-containing protein [Gordonia sp. PP30]|uniref:PucR family transcriptional regulator n=1 Tax=Gordonia sp. PP30 TaxID=2935861 RepID=UPI001FFF8D33|nr:helix-turn-helix domain-containing protein [Gordonia sp. PP30]UQE73680.1 helix-turn-helix domain-containing protein [Gordonia sp. PP30]
MVPRSAANPEITAELARIGEALAQRLGRMSEDITAAIHRDIVFYATSDIVPREMTHDVVQINFAYVIDAITTDSNFDTTPARRTGAQRAALGVPLASLMHAYRIGFQGVWREFRAVVEADTSFSRPAILEASERLWIGHDRFATDMAEAHREYTTERILDDAAERAVLTERLLEGRTTADMSLWEIAALVRMPARGPYVAVAATSTPGGPPLPAIENKLRSIDLRSTWRLLPDQQIGMVHVPSAEMHTALLDLLGRVATGRVGVSARFTDLTDTPKALRYARFALSGPGDGVTVFDDSVLGIAAVSTPDVSTDLAETVLHRLYGLAAEDREPLFETFRAWTDADGNVAATAEALFVHRNTVRHRLRRIEDLTGRSTTSPRELAELCLAFEVDARLTVPESHHG